MKRLVSIITIFFCIYSIFAVTLERKTVLDIFGDPIKEKVLTLSEPLEGKFSDSLHDQETFSWTVSIDENGYVSFDIFENGIPCDLSKFYYLTIAFKVDDTQTPIESSAYVTKSDMYHYNRVVSEKPLIQHVAKAKTVKIVIYNSSCVYNLGAVDVSGLGDLYYDLDSYNKALELIENKELNKAKEILQSMDLPSFNYFECKSLIDEIDTALYLNTAEEKCAEGNYNEARALIDVLQIENTSLYYSNQTTNLISILYFKEGIDFLEEGLIDEGFKKIYIAYKTNVDEAQNIVMAEEVISIIDGIIKSKNNYSDINSVVIISLIHEINAPFYEARILETYANTLIDKELPSSITTENLNQIETIRKYFKKECNNISDETRKFLLDTLYGKAIDFLIKEGQIDNASRVLEEYKTFEDSDESIVKKASKEIENYNRFNRLKITLSVEGDVCIPPLKESIYIEGTYSDYDNDIDYRKSGFATIKSTSNYLVGMSFPLTNKLFVGYRLGLAINGFAFNDGDRKYEAFPNPYLSQQLELGCYFADSIFYGKGFAKYLISLSSVQKNSMNIGFAFGIPYLEVGFILDNMKNPAIYCALQFPIDMQ